MEEARKFKINAVTATTVDSYGKPRSQGTQKLSILPIADLKPAAPVSSASEDLSGISIQKKILPPSSSSSLQRSTDTGHRPPNMPAFIDNSARSNNASSDVVVKRTFSGVTAQQNKRGRRSIKDDDVSSDDDSSSDSSTKPAMQSLRGGPKSSKISSKTNEKVISTSNSQRIENLKNR